MADRSVAVKLRLEASGFIAGARAAQAELSSLGKTMGQTSQSSSQGFHNMGIGLTAIGAAAGAGLALAVSHFMDFDQAMSNVQAATHESASNMALLRNAALDAGAKTKFSATEAAGAVESLAKAGVSTRDILRGGLKGALDLAAAGSMGVADAADVAATAMTQFGLKGKDVPHIADLMAAAAGKAQGEVSDMALALKQSGLVAAQMGLSIEATTGTLAAFASAGLTSSDAGTSLRTMLLRLANPSQQAAQSMKELGINAYDATGKFVGIEALAGQLQTRMGGLTQAQRDQALATIFGSDAIRAANVLYKDGTAGIADWVNKVNDAGYAAQTAAIKQDNLRGDIEKLGGAFDTALIKSGSGANNVLRGMTQQVTSLIDAYSGLPGPVQTAATGIGGLVAVTGLASGGFLLMLPRLMAVKQALRDMAETSPRTASGLVAVGKGAGTAFAALAAGEVTLSIIRQIQDATIRATPGLQKWTGALLDLSRFGQGGVSLTGVFDSLGASVKRLTDQDTMTSWSDKIGASIGVTSKSMREAKDQVGGIDSALAGLVGKGAIKDADQAFSSLQQQFVKGGTSLSEFKALFPQYDEALKGVTNDQTLAAGTSGNLTGATQGQTSAYDMLKDATVSLKDRTNEYQARLESLTGTVMGATSAEIGFEQNLRDLTAAVDKNGKSLDITTDSGAANARILLQLISHAQEAARATYAQTGSVEAANATYQRHVGQIDAVIGKLGLNQQQVLGLVGDYRQIPANLTTNFHLDTSQAMGAISSLSRAISAIAAQSALGIRLQAKATFASGGPVVGPGTSTSDSIDARLSTGEFVMNAAATKKIGVANLNRMNALGMAGGGLIQAPRVVAGQYGGSPLVNVYVQGSVVTERDLVRTVRDGLARHDARGDWIP